jgi:hypothetical protein
MKHILESSETFTAYATIDMCYYELERIQKLLNKHNTPIERAIYDATGFSKDLKEQCISVFEEMIKNKKIILADYSKDEEVLQQLKNYERRN